MGKWIDEAKRSGQIRKSRGFSTAFSFAAFISLATLLLLALQVLLGDGGIVQFLDRPDRIDQQELSK